MKHLHYICDEDFTNIRPVDLMTWAHWLGERENRRVDFTETDKGFVSTVFLGLDHSFFDYSLPLLFETMIFAPGLDCDQEQHRTVNVTAARALHAACVNRLKAHSAPPITVEEIEEYLKREYPAGFKP